MANRSNKLSKRTVRILVAAWVGVMLVVGACVFLGVWFALNGSFEDERAAAVTAQAESAPVQAPDQPTATPLVVATDAPIDPDEAVEDTPLPTATLPPNQDPDFGYGIQVRLELNTEDTLNLVEDLEMDWIKQQLRWADLEPVEGQANWDILEEIFTAAERRGVKVMVSVVAAPEWAADGPPRPDIGDNPPADPEVFAEYVGEIARRFSGQVHAIEIWNEMNLRREWVTERPLSSAEYMTMLVPAAEAIREADPNIIIISGALAPTGINDGNLAINDFQYLQEMINAGLLDYVDCVGAHHNGINMPPGIAYDEGYNDAEAIYRGPFDNPHPSWSFYSTLRGYNDIIVSAGYETPLCVTEFGWPTVEGMDGDPRQDFSFALDNTLDEQAENIVNAFDLMHEWGFVQLAFLFNLDYSPKIGGDTQDDTTLYSILGPDGTPRPAYEAVKDMPKPP